MKKHQIFDWYNGLQPWARSVLIVGGSATLIYSVYSIIKSINAAKKEKEAQAELVQAVKDLSDLAAKGILPTYDTTQYTTWKDAIVSQFSGCDMSFPIAGSCTPSFLSNSGITVYNIITDLKNDADFAALQLAFGTQTITKPFYCGSDVPNVKLSGAISSQLTTGEIACINNLLQAKGITKRF